MVIPGGDGLRRVQDYGDGVARQIERRARGEAKGRESQHRNRGRKWGPRRLLRRFLRRRSTYECYCPTPPEPGERHRLDCELRNERLG